MSEKIIVRQNKDYQIEYKSVRPDQPDRGDYDPVHALHEVTPYGMLLISLASCTSQVVLSYASHHGLNLEAVEFQVDYDRIYKDDCDNCEQIDRYDEIISERITFEGNLTKNEQDKLFKIAHHCPIEKILRSGIRVESKLEHK